MVDLLQITQNIVDDLPYFFTFIGILSFLIGVTLGIVALRAFARRSEMGPNSGSWWSPAATLIIAVLLVALPAFWRTMTVTIFGVGASVPAAEEIFSYAESTIGVFDTDSPSRQIIIGIVAIIQFIGLIAVLRGLLLLNQAAQSGGGQPTFGSGVTFVIAGILAINFPLFMGVVETLITG